MKFYSEVTKKLYETEEDLKTAEKAVADEHGNYSTDDPGGNAFVIKFVCGKGGLEVIGGEHIKANAVGEYQEY